jgi:hypothetical protein
LSKLGIGEVCNLRFEFENIVSNNTYKMQDYGSDIDNLYEFVETGHVNNRFRDGFNRATEIANELIDYYEAIFSERKSHKLSN